MDALRQNMGRFSLGYIEEGNKVRIGHFLQTVLLYSVVKVDLKVISDTAGELIA